MTQVIRYRGDEGTRTGLLVTEGRKYIQLLLMDNPLRIKKVPLAHGKYIEVLEYRLGRAKRIFRDAAKKYHGGLRGCPKTVREVLR